MTLKDVFATNLKRFRKLNNLTQEALAEKLGVAPRHISFIETSKSFPSPELIDKICKTLNISYADLFVENELSSREDLLNSLNSIALNLSNSQLKTLCTIGKNLI